MTIAGIFRTILALALLIQPFHSLVFITKTDPFFDELDSKSKLLILETIDWSNLTALSIIARLIKSRIISYSLYEQCLDHAHSNSLIKTIVRLAINHPPLQDILYPTWLIEKYPQFENVILEYGIRSYKPSRIELYHEKSKSLTKQTLLYLLKDMSQFPHKHASWKSGSYSWEFKVKNGWEFDESSTREAVWKKIDEGFDHDLISLTTLQYFYNHIQDSRLKPSKEVYECLEKLFVKTQWTIGYDCLVNLLKNKFSSSPIGRLALWHGRVLNQTLAIYATNFPTEIKDLIVKFLEAYEVTDIPMYTLIALVESIIKSPELRLSTTIPIALSAKLLDIEHLYNFQAGFWGGIDRYVWRFRLTLEGGRMLSFEANPCNFECLVNAFASQKLARDGKVLMRNKLTNPLILSFGSKSTTCETIQCLLKEATNMAVNECKALYQDTNGFYQISEHAAHLDRKYWIFLAQLIIYSILYLDDVGICFASEVWKSLLSKRQGLIFSTNTTSSIERPLNLMSSALLALDFEKHFPLAILNENSKTKYY